MSKRLFGVRRDLGSYAAQVAATARDDCARNDQARLPARLPREQQTAPGLSFGLNSPPSGIVHRRPPTTHLSSSRTVADPGERWAALLESVLGATPQEFESPILRHADQGKHRSVVPARWRFEARWSHLLVSVLSAQHQLHRDSPQLFARSRVSRTALNREQHAAEACALLFRAGRDRPRPAGYPLNTYRITLSDREAVGEHAPSRRRGRQLDNQSDRPMPR